MNELLAPIYYTFYTDESLEFLNTVESDAFFSFTMFMAEAKDKYCPMELICLVLYEVWMKLL